MSDRAKRIFLGICIVIPFLIYCIYYYSAMIRNAAFRFSDFEYLELVYGTQDSMLNTYNSKTQQYQYLRKDGTLVKDTLRLRNDDLLYLHRKAQELGFWNVDDDMMTPESEQQGNRPVARFILEFVYKEKSKRVTLDADYPGNPKMKDAAKTTIDEVMKMLADAHAR